MFDGWPAQSCHGFALLCDAANGGALRCAALRCSALLCSGLFALLCSRRTLSLSGVYSTTSNAHARSMHR
jgi:hypothetical protein